MQRMAADWGAVVRVQLIAIMPGDRSKSKKSSFAVILISLRA